MIRNQAAYIEAMQARSDRVSRYQPGQPVVKWKRNYAEWKMHYDGALDAGHDMLTADRIATTAQALADHTESFNQWFDELLTNSCK